MFAAGEWLLVAWLDQCLIQLPGWCGSSSIPPLGGDLESSRLGVWGWRPCPSCHRPVSGQGFPACLAAASGGSRSALCASMLIYGSTRCQAMTLREVNKTKGFVQPERPEFKSELHL